MNAWFFNKIALGLALSTLALIGCTRQGAERPGLMSTANAEPAVDPSSVTEIAAAPANVALSPSQDVEVTAVPAPGADKKALPPIVRSNGPAADVIKMAQSGVDESIMLTFITNTPSMFALTSDEIIYLNDLGVPNTVVTAMIQRDQTLKEIGDNISKEQAAQAAAAAAAATAAAASNATPQPEATAAVEAPLTPPATMVDDFSDSLSPYGTWIEVEGYGRCWQPTVVVGNPTWRPYCDRGHWVYTDCGWYWISDYSWGATTFHYGRWFSHPRWGWCWWPDSVWAPSWVSWRYGNDYCGWAPLPPAAYYRSGLGFSYHNRSVGFGFDFGLGAASFTFVPWRNFCDARPYNHRLPHHQATQVFHNTTIVNNYASGNNNTVINRGIPTDRVRERSHTEVRQVNIREAGAPSRGGRLERLDRDGRTLIVNRRESAPVTAPTVRTQSRGSRAETASPFAPASGGTVTRTETTASRTQDRNQRTAPAGGPVVTAPSSGRAGTASTIETRHDTRNNENRGTVRTRDEVRVENAPRDTKRDQPNAAPVVTLPRNAPVASQPKVDRPNATPESKPASRSPLVVIGRPQNSESRRNEPTSRSVDVQKRDETVARRTQNWPPGSTQPPAAAPQVRTAPPQMQTPAPSAVNAPRVERREAQRSSQRFDEGSYTVPRPSPSYTAPRSAPVVNAPPTVIAPSPRSAPSAPTYSPPQSAPVYTAPAPRSQNVESRAPQPQPQPRAESRSEPSRGSGGDNNRKR